MTHWIIDSGTGISLTNDIKNLHYTSRVNNKNIIYPNGKIDEIKQIGNYIGKFNNNDFTLSNVYYTSNIQNNLISTHSILDNGCKIIMEQIDGTDRLQIYKNNKLIANIFENDEHLFTFKTFPCKITSNNNNHIHNINYDLWHARLGHFNNNKDIKLFVLEHTSNHNKKDCHQCKISKLKKKPFYSSFKKAEKPMELVHTDVVGKLENSYLGFNYYVTFLDDYSHKVWVFLLKNKSDVYNTFIFFNKHILNTTPYKIINLKSDNGTEYINKNLISYLQSEGINFIHSIPGNPQQNVRAEKLNQTLNNCAKTLLNSAKLPLKF